MRVSNFKRREATYLLRPGSNRKRPGAFLPTAERWFSKLLSDALEYVRDDHLREEIIGFIGQNADTKQLASGTSVTKFSVATTRSWKDDKGEWKQRTQWHNVLAFGHGFAQMGSRLVKGTHVFVQGELTTREYDRTVSVPSGKKSVERVIQQLAVELKADTIRILDRNAVQEVLLLHLKISRTQSPGQRRALGYALG